MTIELRYVAYAVLLTFVMNMTAAALKMKIWKPSGFKKSVGNREDTPEVTPAAGRAERATRNMYENLPLFIGLVLVASVAHVSTKWTVLGCQVFFWARVLYWPIYVLGIPGVRTAVWAVSIVGLAMIFSQVVTAGAAG